MVGLPFGSPLVDVLFSRVGFPQGCQHPQHYQPHLAQGCLLALIGRQLGVAGVWAGLDLH